MEGTRGDETRGNAKPDAKVSPSQVLGFQGPALQRVPDARAADECPKYLIMCSMGFHAAAFLLDLALTKSEKFNVKDANMHLDDDLSAAAPRHEPPDWQKKRDALSNERRFHSFHFALVLTKLTRRMETSCNKLSIS